MKRFFLLLVIFCFHSISGIAKEPLKSIEAYYSYFEDNYSVEQWYSDTQKMVLWLSEQGEEGIKEFNKENNRFWVYDTFHIFAMVIDCDTLTAYSHPNPINRKVVINKKGIGHKVRDHSGKLFVLEACSEVDKHPDGVITSSYSTWCKTITGLGPLHMNLLTIKIPNTDNVIITWLPTRADSIEEASEIAGKRSQMIKKWPINK